MPGTSYLYDDVSVQKIWTTFISFVAKFTYLKMIGS